MDHVGYGKEKWWGGWQFILTPTKIVQQLMKQAGFEKTKKVCHSWQRA